MGGKEAKKRGKKRLKFQHSAQPPFCASVRLRRKHTVLSSSSSTPSSTPSRPLSFSLRPPPPSSLFGVNVVRTIFLNYYSLLSTCNGNNWECGGENRATKHVLTEGNLACFQRCQPFQNMCEQVLFVRFYNNPAPLNGSMQFHYCTLVTREPEQTTLLF